MAALPSQAPGTTMTLEQLAAFEQRALALLSNYAACTAERVHAQLRGTSDFPGTVQVRGQRRMTHTLWRVAGRAGAWWGASKGLMHSTAIVGAR